MIFEGSALRHGRVNEPAGGAGIPCRLEFWETEYGRLGSNAPTPSWKRLTRQ